MVYSRGSIECEAALRKHIDESREREDAIFKRLRERVTVVTIGSASHNYPAGPAYLHVAAWTDPLSTTSGMTGKHNAEGGGKDAVFLNCERPYSECAFDKHNFGAVPSQYLAVLMATNGEMVEPNEDALKAMIQVTSGREWLWDVERVWQNIPMGLGAVSAHATLKEKFRQEFV